MKALDVIAKESVGIPRMAVYSGDRVVVARSFSRTVTEKQGQ